jgi:hypothetical protein
MTCPLKAWSCVPEETAVGRQWLSKHVSTATEAGNRSNEYTKATIEELLEAVFSMLSVQRLYKKIQLGTQCLGV